jgi:hypothetical protein
MTAPSDENLLGYVLHALDDDEARDLDQRLRDDPVLRSRADRLRKALEPLASDMDTPEPPAGLWTRALGRIAEYQCQQLPATPFPRASRNQASSRPRWRRPDVLVAAGMLICIGLLIPSGVGQARHQYHKVSCQNNLREVYAGLRDYSERHRGAFPDVKAISAAPRDFTGMVFPFVQAEAGLKHPFPTPCPGNPMEGGPITKTFDELHRMPLEEFECYKPRLGANYAYSLGHTDNGRSIGPIHDPALASVTALVADRPPVGIDRGASGNSPNHAGRGQNVLYMDGHSAFMSRRHLGGDDDIYLNRDCKVAAGKDRRDTVLGDSASKP